VYELALGGELFNFVLAGALPERVARMYFRQMIAGIEYIHSRGIYHRDLKFENILLSETLVLKIADFGLSINIANLTKEGTTIYPAGTYQYLPPEIHLNLPYVPAKSDIFAAGYILFTLITGKPPINYAKVDDYFYNAIMRGNFPRFWLKQTKRLGKNDDYFSDDFKNLINSMLHSDPNKRATLETIL
jgi:5'-AMP-activated protein kinase, catalytic alpha subunit